MAYDVVLCGGTPSSLTPKTQEAFGPKTNQRNVAMLHPDMCQTSADQGRIENANRHHLVSTWLPGKNLNNLALKQYNGNGSAADTLAVDGYRVLLGAEGRYMKEQYARITVPPTSAPGIAVGTQPVPEDRQHLYVIEG